MKILKNAFVYSLSLPSIDNMRTHLAELPYRELGPLEACHGSFVPNAVTGELVTPVGDGFSFTFRWDQKLLPKAAHRARVALEVARVEEEEGVVLDKFRRNQISDAIYAEMLAVAFVATSTVTAFYLPEKGYLFVNCASAPMSDRLTSSLVRAVGSVKSTTININGLTMGLTARLRDCINGKAGSFGAFSLGSYVRLKGPEGGVVTYQLSDLLANAESIGDVLSANMEVDSISLVHSPMSFKLTSKFSFKQLSFDILREDDDEASDAAYLWRVEAAAQCVLLAGAVSELCDLLGYVPPVKEEPEAPDA